MTRESFQRFVSEIKARKIRKTLALYISISISILGVTNLFTGVYHLPAVLFDGALILALCGLPGAVLFAWLHGHESPRKIRP